MSVNKRRLAADIGIFVQQYARKRHAGHDPNDRRYDRKMQRKIRNISPEEFDRLMNESAEDEEITRE